MEVTVKDRPVITNFETESLGGSLQVIYKTVVSELVHVTDNTPILDAQIRALKLALADLQKRKESTT